MDCLCGHDQRVHLLMEGACVNAGCGCERFADAEDLEIQFPQAATI